MPSREPDPRRSWLRRHPWSVATAVVLVLTVLATWALGGWERTTPEGVLRVDPGTEVEVAPFAVRLDRAEATYELDGRLADKHRAYVVVEGTLRLTASEAVLSGILGDLFVADLESSYDGYGQPADEPEPAISVAADGTTLLGIGPGLTYDVRVTYVVDEATAPDRLTLTLREHIWRKSSLDGTPGWHDPAPAALVTLDVAPLPAERPKAAY